MAAQTKGNAATPWGCAAHYTVVYEGPVAWSEFVTSGDKL